MEQQQNDHDLLIKLDQKVDNLTAKIDEMTNTTKQQLEDHETRLRWVERVAYFGIAALGIAEIILRFVRLP